MRSVLLCTTVPKGGVPTTAAAVGETDPVTGAVVPVVVVVVVAAVVPNNELNQPLTYARYPTTAIPPIISNEVAPLSGFFFLVLRLAIFNISLSLYVYPVNLHHALRITQQINCSKRRARKQPRVRRIEPIRYGTKLRGPRGGLHVS
jgi:hypothetical protein